MKTLDSVEEIVKSSGIIFLTYGGYLSQQLISNMTEILERDTISKGVASAFMRLPKGVTVLNTVLKKWSRVIPTCIIFALL